MGGVRSHYALSLPPSLTSDQGDVFIDIPSGYVFFEKLALFFTGELISL